MTLYSTYVALALLGLNYHYGTPFIHLAALAGCVYIVGLLFDGRASNPLSLVEICWLLVLLIWPAVYCIPYLQGGSHDIPKSLLNLLRSALIAVPIFLTIRDAKISRDHFFYSILLALAGGVVGSYYNFFIERSSEPFALSSGGINLSIIFGAMLAMLISGVTILSLEYREKDQRKRSLLAFLLVILGTSALLLTGSRGALAAVFLPLLFGLFQLFMRVKNKLLFVVFSALASLLSAPFIFASPLYQKSLLKFQNFSLLGILGERYHLWVGILQSLKGHLLWGVGFGEDKEIIAEYMKGEGLPESYQSIGHIHNDFLQAVFNFGLPLALCMFALLMYAGFHGVKEYLQGEGYVYLLPMAITVSFMISGMSDVIILQAPSMVLFVVLISLSVAFDAPKKNESHA